MNCYSIAKQIKFNAQLYTLGSADGREFRLSSKEVEVLTLLCQHQASTVTRQFLFDNAWPNGVGTDGHLNRVILLLRRKFDSLGVDEVIKTVPKVGYILVEACLCDEEPLGDENESADKHFEVTDPEQELEYHMEYHLENGELLLDRMDEERELLTPPMQDVTSQKAVSSDDVHGTKSWFYASVIIVGIIAVFSWIIFKTPATSSERYAGVNQQLLKNFLLLTQFELDSPSVNEIKNTLEGFKYPIVGKVYISMSPRAASIIHVSDNDETFLKKIYISDHLRPSDLLKCALAREFNVKETQIDTPKGNVHISKDSMVKTFNAEIITGCELDGNDNFTKMLFTLTLTLNTNKNLSVEDKRYRFFYVDLKLTTGEADILNATASGNMTKEIIGSDSWDVWQAKTKNVVSLDTDSASDNTSSLKVLSDFASKDTAVYALKLDEGIYYIDLLDGIVVSTR
ncbi:winged helix-turn-helix domain-containing protein [Shewanella algae]|uniref:winged helix-turn-helix domain-containing protein n=1 Tax=Shewanella algae TaxID=38313 RepID=UPI000F428A67|nr:helix-turn-helix domain-containing protein [Shewanella algae]AYV13685.1 helix-turn-helix domain-containing protein [Shewanella algae]